MAELRLCFELAKTPAELRSVTTGEDFADLVAYCEMYGTPAARIEHATVMGLCYTASRCGMGGDPVKPDKVAYPTYRPPMSDDEIWEFLSAMAVKR